MNNSDQIANLHGVIQRFELLGCWYMAQQLRKLLGELLKERGNGQS